MSDEDAVLLSRDPLEWEVIHTSTSMAVDPLWLRIHAITLPQNFGFLTQT